MDKEFYDKYSNEFKCAECLFLKDCLENSEPLYGKCCERFLRERLKLTEKALELAREYMFNVMCADDVPSKEWFIEKAKEMIENEKFF